MVRHHHPRAQFVTRGVFRSAALRAAALPGILPEIIFDQFGDFGAAQMTFALAFVEIRFELFPPLEVIFNLGKMLPLRTKRFGKAVREMESDELRQSRFIAMRQITPLMPAAKTSLGIFNLSR